VRELPIGTVTLLFTDIEGSTRLLHELGDRYAEALADHRRLLRECFLERDGREVDTQGDAFFVAFPRASDAVAAAAAAQRRLAGHPWPGGVPLRVRMGIHSGEPALTGEGYVGIDLHRGARICAAGHGGQVLLSQTTRELLGGHEPDATSLRDLGEHRLKDLTQPQRLYQLVIAGLATEFPPLRTLENRPTNLPTQPTPLLGRERELEAIGGLLGREATRLVTLTGPGGIGKTRLALQAAAEALDEFPGGVFFVALAATSDPGLVVPTVAQTLGIREGAGHTIDQVLKDHLLDKRLLLLLDNFEQVVEAAPDVSRLLAACPEVKVLVTSREPLHLPGEQEYPVRPLSVPDPGLLSQYEAVALFLQRAQAVRPGFQISNDSAPAVAEICIRLDGLPLAIELAAARVKLLSPQAILARLDQRLKLLTGRARGVPARQQTLRSAIDWRYVLLEEPERRLFARLAVFVGGCTLEAAEAVCSDAELDVDVLDTMASLVDKSLVRQEESGAGEPRFLMLETIREYALERLEADPNARGVRGRQGEYFARLAERAKEGLWRGSSQQAWLERLEDEHANLRAALAWLLEQQQTDKALQLVSGVWMFWLIRGYLREGQRWSEEVLARADRSPSVLRADVMAVLGEFYRFQGDFERSTRVKEEALSVFRRTDQRFTAATLHDLGEIAQAQGQYERALKLHEESLALRRQLGDKGGIAHALSGLADLGIRTGDLPHATALYEEVLKTAREVQDTSFAAFTLVNLAHIARLEANEARTVSLLRQGLSLASGQGETYILVEYLEEVAAVALGRDQAVLAAARLFGASQAIRETSGLAPSFPDDHERNLAQARRQLGEDFAAAWSEGRTMTLEEAVAHALEIVTDNF
jgi:predicted ATPase/class 3 adenylate cyclase